MSTQITINPLTRISGFLQIEVLVENNTIVDAKSSGVLYRGFEKMLKGRPPLDATYFTERICGICSTAHSYVSTLALEEALDISPSANGVLLREFMHGCEFLQNHLRHFYQYTLPDYVKGPKIPPLYTINHTDYRLPDKLNQRLANHYLDSLEYSQQAHEMLAELGGKAPHNHGIFVGGATVNMDASKWIKVKSILDGILAFASNVMLADVEIIAQYYPDCFENGRGPGNLLTYGCFNEPTLPKTTYTPSLVLISGDVQPFEKGAITENIYHAWYQAEQIETKPGGPPPDAALDKDGAYSWIKAPRYLGQAMEVGPLARMWLSGIYRQGISTMNRTIARVLEVIKICNIMLELLESIQLEAAQQQQWQIPPNAQGAGLKDTTRGALGHWISIEGQRILHYDIITPTAWNLSPKDDDGVRGVIEQALIGTVLSDVKHPVEIGRIVRSFDPCVSCATHLTGDVPHPFSLRLV